MKKKVIWLIAFVTLVLLIVYEIQWKSYGKSTAEFTVNSYTHSELRGSQDAGGNSMSFVCDRLLLELNVSVQTGSIVVEIEDKDGNNLCTYNVKAGDSLNENLIFDDIGYGYNYKCTISDDADLTYKIAGELQIRRYKTVF